MKTTLVLLSSLFLSLHAHADGYNWKGTCTGPNELEIYVSPHDDDSMVFIKRDQMVLYHGVVSVSTFEPSASVITFSDTEKGMTLDVRRSKKQQIVSTIVINGERFGLDCDLKSVIE